MRWTLRWAIAAGLVIVFILLSMARTDRDVVVAQTHKPVFITRLYTGPDGQTHAEDIEAKFAGGPVEIAKMETVTGAELHRTPPGRVADWHVGPRRQYVITLSGRGEHRSGRREEDSGGAWPHRGLIEDTTGKGHITRVTGSEDRVAIFLTLAQQR